ncbi:hypothetical protein VFPFJ_01340 [Purpureocillium lilacinum]|uniref:Uncharacterized protein n=1 Tax=Purpureocillium lilacinum TaxID=33203 RepID=A0A179HCH2_PURLI|nr:hypothetical protein VFPFJ_01340 [Purpureocillium lilacinum]OAQ87280.1 hypothetical protein VFPBJ_01320 [Purpureocillium lilacinum]OAQ95231.1 hypothetical protein VFPFJ_01340 [Purpureocillium lilacinum]
MISERQSLHTVPLAQGVDGNSITSPCVFGTREYQEQPRRTKWRSSCAAHSASPASLTTRFPLGAT